MENRPLFSFLILITKKVIYNAFKQKKLSQNQQVISDMRKVFYSERYKASIKGKQAPSDQTSNTISNYFDNNKGP